MKDFENAKYARCIDNSNAYIQYDGIKNGEVLKIQYCKTPSKTILFEGKYYDHYTKYFVPATKEDYEEYQKNPEKWELYYALK